MGIQTFNERFLGNAAVPKTGDVALPTASAPPSAKGMPSAVQHNDGTASPRTTVQTKQAARPSIPSGGKRVWPTKVDSFDDDSV